MTSPLARRIASAAVLAPIAIAAALAGPPAYAVLVAVFAAAMGWEWARLCMDGRAPSRIVGIAVAAMLGTVLAAAAHGPDAGIIVALAGGVILGIALRGSAGRALLAGAGMGYLAVATVAVLAIRGPAEASPWPTLWLFAVVWTVDVAAYFVGRTVGGPRLAPAISPGKTWSGFFGGTAGGVLVGWAVAAMAGGGRPGLAILLALALAVVAQIGDLAESAAKRYFGVKDASGLIPGHGGVLDRLDGLMAAALALALLRVWVGEDISGWL